MTLTAAALFAAGDAAAAAGAAILAEGVLKTMLLNKLTSVGTLLVLVALACGAGGFSLTALAAGGIAWGLGEGEGPEQDSALRGEGPARPLRLD